MMITSLKQPVPAVGGGAIQTLITTLLDENEIHKKFRFIVISVSNKKAEAYHYNYSRIYFCHRGIIKCGFLPLTYAVCYFFKLLGKREKTVRKIFGVIPANKESIAINSFFMQCCRIAKKEKVDLVICEGTMNPPQYERFHRIVGRDNLFYHLHCHKTEDLSVRNAVPNSIAISQFVKKEWAITPISGSRNIVLYNGIDIKGFSTEITKEQRKALRNRYGVLDDEFLAVYCGRIVPVKGVEELLKAFQLLKGHPVKLLLIGSVAFSGRKTRNLGFFDRISLFEGITTERH